MLALSKVSRGVCLRRVMAYFLVYCMLFNPSVLLAINHNTDISSHTGTVNTAGSTPGVNTIIDIGNSNPVINWTNFNTQVNEDLNFKTGAGIAVLNNISGGQTQFDGNLHAKGIMVFAVNTDGIVFGPKSFIHARQFVASGLAITEENFVNGLNGQDFIFNGGAGQVKNYGEIKARKVALIGSIVRNMGTILAKNGCVAMAAGKNVVLATDGSNITVIPTAAIVNNPSNYVVDNGGGNGTGLGKIRAKNGNVVLAAGDIFSTALEGIESLSAEAIGSAVFTGDIHAKAYSGSDNAIADVTIITGSDFIVNHKITAVAEAGNGFDATAGVTIDSGGSVTVNNLVKAEATTIGGKCVCGPAEAVATVAIKACQDVIVNAAPVAGPCEGDAKGGIKAKATGGSKSENTATVDVKACHDVIVNAALVNGLYKGDAEGGLIKAEATGGSFSENTATVEVKARHNVIVNAAPVNGLNKGDAEGGLIKAKATGGCFSENMATVDVKAGHDVIVDGQIKAVADGSYGSTNLASVDIGATHDVIVSGQIKAEADAETGWLWIIPLKGLSSEATVDILAGHDFMLTGEIGNNDVRNGFGQGQIKAIATDSWKNVADVGITACGDATIDGQITAVADGGFLAYESANVNIWAGNEILGSGEISVQGYHKSIVFHVTDDGKILFDGSALFDGSTGKWDIDILEEFICPECDWDFEWCQECEEPRFVPAAPLEQVRFPTVEGCPAEMQAAAAELGIATETLQVAMGSALALNPTIQPCNACAKLINAAAILKDPDGTQIAALARVVNEFAATPAPPSPAQMASIATSLANPVDGTHYAAAGQWVDALVEYVGVLNTEMGWSTEESTALAMSKYGATGDATLTEFVKMRLAALGG